MLRSRIFISGIVKPPAAFSTFSMSFPLGRGRVMIQTDPPIPGKCNWNRKLHTETNICRITTFDKNVKLEGGLKATRIPPLGIRRPVLLLKFGYSLIQNISFRLKDQKYVKVFIELFHEFPIVCESAPDPPALSEAITNWYIYESSIIAPCGTILATYPIQSYETQNDLSKKGLEIASGKCQETWAGRKRWKIWI